MESVIRLYYEGLSKGVLHANRCRSCGKLTFPPTTCCEHCGSWQVQDTHLSGNATLLYATHNITPACHPRFEKIAPYVYGHIRLEEGPIIQAIVVGVSPTPEDLESIFKRGPLPVKAETLQMDDLPVLAFRVAG